MEREYIRPERTLAGKAGSLWLDTAPETSYPLLEGAHEADVVVVGGGLAGAMTAALLCGSGRSVTLVEARRLCGGATGHTTAKVSVQHGLTYKSLLDRLGELPALIYAEANVTGLNLIAALAEDHAIDCDFHRTPHYLIAETEEEAARMREEAEVGRRFGLPVTLEGGRDDPFPVRAAMRVDAQAQFHPVKFVLGLVKAFAGDGLRVYEGSRVLAVEDRRAPRVVTKSGEVRASEVVLCTHFPIHDRAGFFARLYAHMDYAWGARVARPVPPGMFFGAGEHGIRSYPAPGDPLVIVSGEQHKTGRGGDERERYAELDGWARERLDVTGMEYHWSTEDYYTADGIPYVGLSPGSRHMYLATGFGGWGMTNASAAAILIRDLIVKGGSPWADVFDPGRISAGASWKRFLTENLGVARAFVAGKVSRGERRAAEELRPNEGAVVSGDGGRRAAYRGPTGELRRLDPTCPHLYCEVRSNQAEKTWDCPCHGSRFDAEGRPVDGPATRRMRRAELPEDSGG